MLAFLSACSSTVDSVSDYNEKLLTYEKKLNECNGLEAVDIKGAKLTGVSDEAIRIGLSYLYIKNSIDCTSKESEDLAASVDNLIDDQGVAEYIRVNARDLKETFSFQSQQLIEPEKYFNSLGYDDRKALNSISISSRPFNPSTALEYYIEK